MNCTFRGVGAVVSALALAPLSLTLLCLTGCRSETPSRSLRYVRTDALLSLHPAWTQTRELERLGVQSATLPAFPALQTPVAAPPNPLTLTEGIPPSLVENRQRRIREDAERYIKQLRDFLERRDLDLLGRDVQAFQREERARMIQKQGDLDAKERTLRAEFEGRANVIEREVRGLELREAILQLNLESYRGALRRDTEAILEQIQGDLLAARGKRNALTEQLKQEIAKLNQFREDELLAAVEKYRQQRERELLEGRTRTLARENERLTIEADAIPPLEGALSAQAPEKRLPPVPPPNGAVVGARSAPVLSAAAQRARSNWEAQKQRLIGVIRADTERAVQQIAERQGWALTTDPKPFTPDATAEAARILAEQWRVP